MVVMDTPELDEDEAEEIASGVLAEFLGRLFDPVEWHARAACLGQGVDPFFGEIGERPEARRIREWDAATRFCSACAVLDECRAYARSNAELGLWGDENEEDRAGLGIYSAFYIGNAARIYAERKSW